MDTLDYCRTSRRNANLEMDRAEEYFPKEALGLDDHLPYGQMGDLTKWVRLCYVLFLYGQFDLKVIKLVLYIICGIFQVFTFFFFNSFTEV